MKKKQIKFNEVPMKQRRVVAISPGLFFADDWEMKWPKASWEDEVALARELHKKDMSLVAFRRFIYDPEDGQKFMDKGWVYFGGKIYKGADVVAGKSDFPCGDITKNNIENNHIKNVVWFSDAHEMYPLNRNDKFVQM